MKKINREIKRIICTIARKLNVSVSKYAVSETVDNHPISNSIVNISDCLSKMGIANQIIALNNKLIDRIVEFPFPFISYQNRNLGEFVIVDNAMNGGNVTIYSATDGVVMQPKVEFMKSNSGRAIVITGISENQEMPQRNLEFGLLREINMKIMYLLMLLLFSLFIFKLVQFSTYNQAGFILLNSLNIFISLSLILKDSGQRTIIDRVCQISKISGCTDFHEKVKKKGASTRNLPIYGFAYFCSTVALYTWSALTGSPLTLVHLSLSFIGCSFAVYSILEQILQRSFCLICSSVAIILLIAPFLIFKSFSLTISPSHIIIGEVLFTLTFGYIALNLGSWISHSVKADRNYEELAAKYESFKFDEDVIDSLWKKNKLQSFDQEQSLRLFKASTPKAEIIVITNPNCTGCSDFHQKLMDFLEINKNYNISIGLHSDHKEDEILAKYLCEVYRTSTNEVFIQTFDKIFRGQVDLLEDILSSREYKVRDEQYYKKHKEFVDAMSIPHTPYVLLNDLVVHKEYDIKDIIAIIG